MEGTVQEGIAKEVEEVAKKRVGPDASITFQVNKIIQNILITHFLTQDTWGLKSICVKGERVNL